MAEPFRLHESLWLQSSAASPVIVLRDPASPNWPIRASPVIRVPIHVCHVSDYPLWPNFQLSPTVGKSACWGHQSVVICYTCPNQVNLIRFSACSVDWALWLDTLHFTDRESILSTLPISHVYHSSYPIQKECDAWTKTNSAKFWSFQSLHPSVVIRLRGLLIGIRTDRNHKCVAVKLSTISPTKVPVDDWESTLNWIFLRRWELVHQMFRLYSNCQYLVNFSIFCELSILPAYIHAPIKLFFSVYPIASAALFFFKCCRPFWWCPQNFRNNSK